MKSNYLEEYGVKFHIVEKQCPNCDNNKFIVADECYCHVDFDGAGYTFNDEYGDCSYCDGTATCEECQGDINYEE